MVQFMAWLRVGLTLRIRGLRKWGYILESYSYYMYLEPKLRHLLPYSWQSPMILQVGVMGLGVAEVCFYTGLF